MPIGCLKTNTQRTVTVGNMDHHLISKTFRVEYVYPETLHTHFVSSLVVQHQPEHFILSFFELWPPAILGETDDDTLAALNAVDRVDATCVARLVVTPAMMREFIQVMSDNVERYDAMITAVGHAEREG